MRLLLIHGAWHGAWCFERLIAVLAAQGRDAAAFDLPGHGDDPADPSAQTLDRYVAAALARLDVEPEPVVLLGHSFGGVIAAALSEARPAKVAAALYLCAYLPKDGESLADVERRRADAPRGRHLTFDGPLMRLRADALASMFYNDCAESDVRAAAARLTPQPIETVRAKIALGAGFARTPRAYIACARDRAIPLAVQKDIAARSATPLLTLDAGHSPFLSAPAALARAIAEAEALANAAPLS